LWLLWFLSRRQFITGFSFNAFRIAGHDHPLQVDRDGPARLGLLGNDDLAAQVDPAVHNVDGSFADLLAVDVQDDSVPEDSEVNFVPFLGKDLSLLPRQRLYRSVVLQDGEFHRFQFGVEADGELRLSAAVGDTDEVPLPSLEVPVVPERRHEAELLRNALIENP